MAITVRIGNENDFKPAKLLPGEPAASLDTPKFRIGIGSGKYLELATIQELQDILDASQEEYEAFQSFINYLRENPNAYDAIIAQLDALPGKYVQLTNLTQLTEQNLTLETLNPGNYYALSAVANTFADKPEGVTLAQSYVTVYWDFWTTGNTTKRIELISRGDGRKWYKSYDGTKWGNWIEYTRNEEIADKTKLTQYINWTDLGVPVTSDYATIVNAMINNSVAILPVNSTDNNPNHPTQYGTLEILKTNFGPVHFTFTRPYKGLFDKWCGTYRTNLGFSGWKKLTYEGHNHNSFTPKDVSGQTLDIQDLAVETPEIEWFRCGTNRGAANISNIPVANLPFFLEKKVVRGYGTGNDFIARFRFLSSNKKEYECWCTVSTTGEKTWTDWQEITFATESLNVQTLNSVAKLARMQANTLNDDQAKEVKELYDTWEPGKEYKAGDRVNYIRNLYRVLQDHTSQEGWEPNQTPALFTAITIYDDNIELWTQPSGSTDAY